MDANTIERALIIGAGTMGHGIAQVLAMIGIETRLADVNEAALESAMAKVRANLDKGVDKGKVEAHVRDAALARLSTTTDLAGGSAGVHCVIEAVPERLELKQGILSDLGARLGPDVLLASNTSSLPLTEIAKVVPHPERVVGMHFFNPVHIMKLVEVVRADQSSDAAVAATVGLATRMGKDPITVIDRPGFASSRLGIAIGMEAIRMVEEGVASAQDIDKAMTLGYGFPMGPLKLTDLVGLDVRLSIADYLSEALGPRFEPPALLRQMVERGELGKKSGQGFYDWS
ncbi:3-hydroxyacyl-CoA dehydrogenase family protein [Engelhardtia mirabilis]|uniref:Putative 3-hydroxybutyryl-CoA dehydrogenase n=1 Tax=Engelhardtia mirabilis TaxID=2528011 RepID=A0A518BQR6_9BACT|nr:putative 3-hydroxybutyryl-CoA dehydrogenase [Planctomycetes bacterium Pla133]QDV03622.1 putative 3-hydroxybutyryl-CoA dehydrogenase [Planctomycetes bacterium Pla86]